MQALEELAMSYDSKDKEIDLAYNERDQVKLELETLKVGTGNGNSHWPSWTVYLLPCLLAAKHEQSKLRVGPFEGL